MPRKPIDYSKTIIYKIVSKDLLVTQCYVGHTTNFINRKRDHKYTCNIKTRTGYNLYVYTFIRENGGWKNYDMIEIEKYSCLDVNEAHKRERYWIETLNAELNKVIPTRTTKEYEIDNKEQKKEYLKDYYQTNKHNILEQQKNYYEQNKDRIKEQQKEYNEKHKDIIRANYDLKYKKIYNECRRQKTKFKNNFNEVMEELIDSYGY
jgi:hypothetical protein